MGVPVGADVASIISAQVAHSENGKQSKAQVDGSKKQLAPSCSFVKRPSPAPPTAESVHTVEAEFSMALLDTWKLETWSMKTIVSALDPLIQRPEASSSLSRAINITALKKDIMC